MINKELFTLIEVSEICRMEINFIKELAGFGIIELYEKENKKYLSHETINLLNMVRRLHFDLGINKEGIEVILSMRRQIMDLQEEVTRLENKINQQLNEEKFRNLDIIINKGLLIDL
jgi:chaperone modulatory protein CbpM